MSIKINVTLTKLGTPDTEVISVTIPYKGDIFEFLAPEIQALAHKAKADESGSAKDGNIVATITYLVY